MAIRNIVKAGDDVLFKVSKVVDTYDKKLHQLLDDMAQTMYKNEGAGLAAPQIGILKRIVVIDVGNGLIELINPEIIEQKGEQTSIEGCLSCPGKFGYTKRPMYVTVKAYDRFGKEFVIKGKEVLAKAFCHEIDHLEGKLFLDKVIEFIDPRDLE